MERSHSQFTLGKNSQKLNSQRTSTGETLMESTIFHGTRTNISQFTVDHAGHKVPPQPLLIDSTSFWEIRTQLQLLSMLKQLLTAKQVVHAKVVTQVVFMNSLPRKVSQIPHASNTLLPTSINLSAKPSISARTAHGHHPQLASLAKINVGLLSTNTTTFPTTTASVVPLR